MVVQQCSTPRWKTLSMAAIWEKGGCECERVGVQSEMRDNKIEGLVMPAEGRLDPKVGGTRVTVVTRTVNPRSPDGVRLPLFCPIADHF